MSDSTDILEIDLRAIGRALRNNAGRIIIGTVLLTALVFLYQILKTPQFTTTTTLLVESKRNLNSDNFSDVRAGENSARSYATIVESRTIIEMVHEELGLPLTVDQLSGHVSAEVIAGTQLIEVSVTYPDATQSAAIANLVAENAIEHIFSLQASPYFGSEDVFLDQLNYFETELDATRQALTQQPPDEQRLVLEERLVRYGEAYLSALSGYEQVRLAQSAEVASIIQTEAAFVPPDADGGSLFITLLAFGLSLSALILISIGWEFLRDGSSQIKHISTQPT